MKNPELVAFIFYRDLDSIEKDAWITVNQYFSGHTNEKKANAALKTIKKCQSIRNRQISRNRELLNVISKVVRQSKSKRNNNIGKVKIS
jgi:hypothetical protein